MKRRAGFTLLEVLVAVTILAVGLSALFTSEAGAIRIAQRARTTTIATLLARCKMAEIEERISKEGWPGTDLEERDDCCVDAEHEGFSCEWSVKRVVLPELDTGEGGALEQLKDGVAGGGGVDGTDGTPGGGTDPLSNIGIPLGGMGGGEGGILGSIMTSSGGGGDPFAALVMEFTFPILKPVIEEQVRRATVVVHWKEGSSDQSFDVVQYLVNELPMVVPEDDDDPPPPPPPPP